MTRLRKLAVAELSEDQRSLYDDITGGPRAKGPQAFSLTDSGGQLVGPFNAMLLSPELGRSLQALGAAVRYGTGLTDREREIAILIVASAWDSAFERYAHEAVGRAVGLTIDEMVSIRSRTVEAFRGRERRVAETVHALAGSGDLDDAAYRVVVDELGEDVLFQLTTLVGYYATLALQLRVFGVAAPEAPTAPA